MPCGLNWQWIGFRRSSFSVVISRWDTTGIATPTRSVECPLEEHFANRRTTGPARRDPSLQGTLAGHCSRMCLRNRGILPFWPVFFGLSVHSDSRCDRSTLFNPSGKMARFGGCFLLELVRGFILGPTGCRSHLEPVTIPRPHPHSTLIPLDCVGLSCRLVRPRARTLCQTAETCPTNRATTIPASWGLVRVVHSWMRDGVSFLWHPRNCFCVPTLRSLGYFDTFAAFRIRNRLVRRGAYNRSNENAPRAAIEAPEHLTLLFVPLVSRSVIAGI
jgi:hypothetical protein